MVSKISNKQINQQARSQRPQMGSGSICAVRRACNRIWIVAFVVLGVMMLSPIQVVAQQTWSLNKLNPLNILPKSDMRLPEWPKWATVKMPEVDLVPAWMEMPKPADIPAGLSELHRSTTRGINKTVNFLNPFYDKPPQLVHRPPTGTRNVAGEAKSTTTNSFWFSAFMAEDESARPSRTVHDFLGRPRLGR
ncbi:hypothetical protein OAO39_00430 [Pirellulaceae bacterium]|jgi:hypothetical protein|nr:hypothetical protein [Pirellulaceae bacterium]